MKKNDIERYITEELEEKSFEEILEIFDLDPVEVFVGLFEQGLIDEELLISVKSV